MTVKLWRAAIPLFAAVTLTLSAGQSQGTGNSVWLIPIETDITPATAEFVVSRVRQANWEQPLAVVFLIDTNGGQVAAMQRIVDTILTRAELPTIAVVEKAFSAGALIAMSAEQLAMLPGASIGAAPTDRRDSDRCEPRRREVQLGCPWTVPKRGRGEGPKCPHSRGDGRPEDRNSRTVH